MTQLEALASLVADLYAQVAVLQQENARLREALRGLEEPEEHPDDGPTAGRMSEEEDQAGRNGQGSAVDHARKG